MTFTISVRLAATLFVFNLMLFNMAMASEAEKTVLLWGDSLSAGYGVPAEKRWATLLKHRLEGSGYALVNGSISGETTRGGATRLPAALARYSPDIMILELGGNDGLRGIKVEEMAANLRSMLRSAKERDTAVLILGMKIPPNYGPQYTREFEGVFRTLSKAFDAPLVPFFLEGVASDYNLMQADGIHPNAAAQPKMLENVWPALEKLIQARQNAVTSVK